MSEYFEEQLNKLIVYQQLKCKCENNKNGIYRLIDAVIYSTRDIIKLLILIDTYSSSN